MEQITSEREGQVAPYNNSTPAFKKVTEKISEGISGIAQRIDSESSRIGEVQSGVISSVAPEIRKYGHMTAEALERSADYVHDLNIDELKDQTKASIRRNPGRAVLIAAGAGFLLGALFKRRGI
jgi:ElaB/YqjD/DUF883 family membrane-anchored ribosome-binding protein